MVNSLLLHRNEKQLFVGLIYKLSDGLNYLQEPGEGRSHFWLAQNDQWPEKLTILITFSKTVTSKSQNSYLIIFIVKIKNL